MNLKTATRHPLSAIFGDPTPEERADHLASIREIGYTDPYIVFKDDQILDGWTRLGIGREEDIIDQLVAVEYEDVYDAGTAPPVAQYVLAKNLNRRHLSASKRAVIVSQLIKSDDNDEKVSLQQAADMAGVSPTTMSEANTIVEAGKANDVLEGDASVQAAAAKHREETGEKKKAGRPKKTKEAKEETKAKKTAAEEATLDEAAAQVANKEHENQKLQDQIAKLQKKNDELEEVITGYEVDSEIKSHDALDEVHKFQDRIRLLESDNTRLMTENEKMSQEIAKLRSNARKKSVKPKAEPAKAISPQPKPSTKKKPSPKNTTPKEKA